MPLLVGNLQRLAESKVHPPQDTEADGQAPRDPRHGRWEPAAQHVVPAGESDARMRVSQNRGNAAQVYENDTHLTGNAAQNHHRGVKREILWRQRLFWRQPLLNALHIHFYENIKIPNDECVGVIADSCKMYINL